MDKNSKKPEEKFIQSLVKLFGEPDQNELKKDIDKAKNLKDKTKSINEFLKKYANLQIDNQTSQQMIHDIISKLISFRKDFVPFMQIYIASTDEIKAEALRNHFILKEKKMNKVEDGDINGDAFIEFGVSLSCLFDEESYYKKFVQGILLYLRAAFKENYLLEYIENGFFQFLDKSKYYKENSLSLIHSLNNMLVDINRVICENSKKEINKDSEKEENKMTKSKFGVFLIKSRLYKNEEIQSIYDKCKNNEEILKEVNNLLENNTNKIEDEFCANLTLFKNKIEKFIEKEKKDKYMAKYMAKLEKTIVDNNIEMSFNQKQIRDLIKEKSDLYGIKEEFGKIKNMNNNLFNKIDIQNNKIKEIETVNSNQAKKIGDLETANSNLVKKIGDLETANVEFETANSDLVQKIGDLETANSNLTKKIGDLEENNSNIETDVQKLKEKVNFMEPIVLSLISRKVINYSIIKILERYKKKINVTFKYINNDIKFKIAFKDSVNNISKDQLNALLDNLFNKKDEFNDNSHLVNKNIPVFIPDIWGQVKQHLKLKQNEMFAFDALITNEIKSGFNFGDDDLSVKNYLKNVNINEFGK